MDGPGPPQAAAMYSTTGTAASRRRNSGCDLTICSTRDRRLQGTDRPMRTGAVSQTAVCLQVRGQATKP